MTQNSPHMPITWSNPLLYNVFPCKRCSYLTFGNFFVTKTHWKIYTNDATTASSFLSTPWFGAIIFSSDLHVTRNGKWKGRMICKRPYMSSSYRELKLICCWWQHTLLTVQFPRPLYTWNFTHIGNYLKYVYIFWSYATLLKLRNTAMRFMSLDSQWQIINKPKHSVFKSRGAV